MSPVRRRDLGVLAVGLAVAAWLLVRTFYGDLPPLQWWLAVPLGVLAVGEALGARSLRGRLAAEREARRSQQPSGGTAPVRPVEPMLVARSAVLAQASAYVGAAFTGIWAGVLVHVATQLGRLQSASGDAVAAVLGVVFSLALVVAALWLESVCRVPPTDGADGRGPGARA